MDKLRILAMLLIGVTTVPLLGTPVAAAEEPLREDRLMIASPGELPVLITAPHGGTTGIAGVPVREVRQGERVTLRRDELTNRLAMHMADELERRLGKRPYLVVAEFSRKSLDANRPEATAYQHRAAAAHYQDYHGEISRFTEEIRKKWGHGLLLDLHAQWQRPEAIMRGTRDGHTVSGLLKRRGWEGLLGRESLLGSLRASGVDLFPPPGESEGRWTHIGSFTVVTHGRDGIDGLQLEIGSGLCDSENDVQQLARQLAVGIETHLKAEQQLPSVDGGDEDAALTALVGPKEDEPATSGSDDSEPAGSLNEAEQAFVDLLANCVLVGRFSIDGTNPGTANPERYAITKVTKTGGDNWIVEARITYGQVDIPVPVPVKVHWAGDTPVISLTDLKIPGLGEGFTTRVLFYKDRYAGSWYHGKVGGHMWGRIEQGERPSTDGTEPGP